MQYQPFKTLQPGLSLLLLLFLVFEIELDFDFVVYSWQGRCVVFISKVLVPTAIVHTPEFCFVVICMSVKSFHALELLKLPLNVSVGANECFGICRSKPSQANVKHGLRFAVLRQNSSVGVQTWFRCLL
jgi:hypothetical protein